MVLPLTAQPSPREAPDDLTAPPALYALNGVFEGAFLTAPPFLRLDPIAVTGACGAGAPIPVDGGVPPGDPPIGVLPDAPIELGPAIGIGIGVGAGAGAGAAIGAGAGAAIGAGAGAAIGAGRTTCGRLLAMFARLSDCLSARAVRATLSAFAVVAALSAIIGPLRIIFGSTFLGLSPIVVRLAIIPFSL